MPYAAPQYLLLGGVALVLAIVRWRSGSQRVVAIAALLVTLFAFAIVAHTFSDDARRSWVSVDGIILPEFSLVALVVGFVGIFRGPTLARVSALALALVSGAYVAQPFLERRAYERSAQARRLGRQLYWEEAIRCQGNLDSRFGPLKHGDLPCRGHMLVTSRRTHALPLSRVIVTDDEWVYLLRLSEPGFEDEWPSNYVRLSLREPLEPPNYAAERVSIALRAEADGNCEATIDSNQGRSVFELAKALALPVCEVSMNPSVRVVGTWSALQDSGPDTYGHKRVALTEILLWESQGEIRGVLVQGGATSGKIGSVGGTRIQGRPSGHSARWDMYFYDDGYTDKRILTLAVINGKAHVHRFDIDTDLEMEPKLAFLPPRVALAPIQNADRFASYFDTVLGEIYANWTAPGSK